MAATKKKEKKNIVIFLEGGLILFCVCHIMALVFAIIHCICV